MLVGGWSGRSWGYGMDTRYPFEDCVCRRDRCRKNPSRNLFEAVCWKEEKAVVASRDIKTDCVVRDDKDLTDKKGLG